MSHKPGNSSEKNCGFTNGSDWFRYRAAGIIVEDGCVLFVRNELEDYYYSVGGAVHLGETAEEAVLREVFEETGVRYEIDRLAVIHENFFNENTGSLKGFECHEICLYFLLKPRGTKELKSNSWTLGVRENMVWLPIEKLDEYKVFPSFMKDYLSRDHAGIEHIITDERRKGDR
ncbi:MAG: NUDIX domain-containing protein [Flexilinea sp.]|nr:NUDIX domain-containing protein [Flexilinea sp.]